jgi:5-methylcytosine-specific restriction endonuclease McrA
MDHLKATVPYCATKGCPNRAHGHCPEHATTRQRADTVVHSSDSRLHTQRWRRYSKRFLAVHPFCDGYPRGVHGVLKRLSQCTDHIVPARQCSDARFWDPANHQPLCHDCNRRKGIAEEGGFARAAQP